MSILAIVGLATVLYLLVRLAALVRTYTANFSYRSYKGEWAVVTGASGGLGEAFVLMLAKRGINVVMLARSRDKLQKLAETIETKYKVRTLVVPFDFASASESDWASLAESLGQLKVSVLINNVGINVEFPTDFLEMSRPDVSRIVHVNINSTNVMTALLLPGMVDQKRGVVLCLASGGGAVSPAPMLTPYSGTKAYNDMFAVSLSGEVKAKGVHVHSLTPFFVKTPMAKMRESFTVPSATKFADLALRQVGSGSPRLQPYWVHYALGAAIRLLPLSMQCSYVDGLHRKIRKKALRKKEREAAKAN